jgi:hypothetical protein
MFFNEQRGFKREPKLDEELSRKLRNGDLKLEDFVQGEHLKDNYEAIELFLSLIHGYSVADFHDWSQNSEEEKRIVNFFYVHVKNCPDCRRYIQNYHLDELFEKIS